MGDASSKQLAAKYPLKATVECVVQRVEPFGVLVRLLSDPQVAGLVRKGEWDWSRGLSDLSAAAAVGQQIRAQVVGHHGSQVALSRRRLLPDPFPDFKTRHKLGEVVLGRITFVSTEKGIHVKLTDGVDGFIPRSEMPETLASEEGFGLLAQDWIAASIQGYADDQVRLSIKEHLLRQDREYADTAASARGGLRFHPSLGPQLEDIRISLQLQEYSEPQIDPRVREIIRRILIVEDRSEVSESLELLFEYYGFPADVVASVDLALKKLAEAKYDLLILDINLPVSSGVELIRELRSRSILLYVFVLTATAAEEWRQLAECDRDLVSGLFQKPTKAAAILESLNRQITKREIHDDRTELPGFSRGTLDPSPLLPERGEIKAVGRDKIERLLHDLLLATQATQACVLSYRPGPHFEVVAGEFPALTVASQQDLDISPIGDVLKERHPLLAFDVARQHLRFKHLLTVLPVGSFAGYPLAHSDQAAYGIFLIGRHPRQLRNTSEEPLRAAALEISHLLAQERLNALITENQGLLLTGFLADSLMHEIKNALQGLDSFSDLQVALAKRYEADLTLMTSDHTRDLKRSITEIQKITADLAGLVRLFQNLAGQPPAETVDLNAVIKQVKDALHPFADKKGITLIVVDDPRVPEIRASPKFIEQPLLNLVINAIEQTATSRRSYRWVRIATDWNSKSDFPVGIVVEDNGPGIHFVNYDRIFDLFFTTKQRGTGLGLYLARFFIEQTRGRLQLVRSLRFSGSEFRIDFPLEVIV
jgi:signal transduction histidine kinase